MAFLELHLQVTNGLAEDRLPRMPDLAVKSRP